MWTFSTLLGPILVVPRTKYGLLLTKQKFKVNRDDPDVVPLAMYPYKELEETYPKDMSLQDLQLTYGTEKLLVFPVYYEDAINSFAAFIGDYKDPQIRQNAFKKYSKV